jgi:hypothetical protein
MYIIPRFEVPFGYPFSYTRRVANEENVKSSQMFAVLTDLATYNNSNKQSIVRSF